jgi:hypothetical protein
MRVRSRLLVVDGYNMIGYWPELASLSRQDRMADARDLLLQMLSEYSKYKGIHTRVVFDAQLVPGIEATYDYKNLSVVFTKTDETADSYIERTVGEENSLLTQVTVATSDYAIQNIILQKGASRKSARELYRDVIQAKKEIKKDIRLRSSRNYHKRNSPWKDEDRMKLSSLYEKLIDDDEGEPFDTK